MTKKIFYEKKGRRYVPVSEYDSDYLDSFPRGSHLVICYPGGSSRRFNIDPNYAALIAAGRVAEDIIADKMIAATELKPRTTPITPAARKAWLKLKHELGDEAILTRPSARDIADAAVKAMQEEADKLMSNPAVRKAYERFILVCELTKDHTQ